MVFYNGHKDNTRQDNMNFWDASNALLSLRFIGATTWLEVGYDFSVMPVVRNAVGYLSFLTLFGYPTGEYSFLPLDALAVVWICICCLAPKEFLKLYPLHFFVNCQLHVSLSSGKQSLLLIFHHRQCFFAKKSGTWIRWKPSWCWISTSTARFDPTTFRLGNQKNGAFGGDVLEEVWCIFGGEKLDTAESHNLPIKKRQNSTYTKDRYHRKDCIIMHNNLCFLMFFSFSKGRAVHVEMNLEVVQHWPWMLDTWGLPRIWLALWEWSGRNCASWHSFSDVDSQVEGFPFFRV